jgi:subtilisin family serine protease
MYSRLIRAPRLIAVVVAFALLMLAAGIACGRKGAGPSGVAPEFAREVALEQSPLEYYPDRIILKFSPGAQPPVGAGVGGESLPNSVLYQNEGPALFARYLAREYGMELSQEAYVRRVNWACYQLDSPERAAELMRDLPAAYPSEIEYAEYDGRFELEYVPNDPYYPANLWGLVKINAATAWDTTAGSGVKIAILDTGVRYNGNTSSSVPDHEDLNANVMNPPDYWPNEKLDLADDDNIPHDPTGVTAAGHGTHVAGIAAAVGDNGLGVVGIAYQASIIPIRIFDSTNKLYYSRAAQAVTLATEIGADIANMSFAGSWFSYSLNEALEDAHDQGVLLVAAVGNKELTKPWYPAGHKSVIAVGATNVDDARADFSNYGPWLDIAAPGVSLRSTYNRSSSDYYVESGTSMATPLVAGVGALLMAANPSLTVDQVRAILEGSGVDLPDGEWDNTTIRRLDAAAALGFSLGTAPSISITSPADNDTVSGLVTFSVSASDSDGTIKKVYFYAGNYLLATDTTSPFSITWDTTKFPNTSYKLQAVAFDDKANRKEASINVTVNNSVLQPDYFTDFEAGTAGWWSDDQSGSTSWHLTTSDAYSPTHSFKMGDTGGSSYGNSEYDLLYSPVFDLSYAQHVRVKFYHKHQFGNSGDGGFVTVNTGDGEYYIVGEYHNQLFSWTQESILLDDYLGQSIQVVFLMEGDNTVNSVGWFIDDFRLQKSTNPPSVNITSHNNNDVVSGTITITATATDDVEVTKTELWVNNTLKGTDTIPPYSYSFNTLNLHGGDNTFEVRAYDEFPLMASASVNLIVRNQSISSIFPLSATAGAAFSVFGNNFLGIGDTYNPTTDKVKFTGVSGLVEASVSMWFSGSIICTVPADAVNGPVYVTIGSSSAASSQSFTIKPSISSLNPNAEIAGNTISVLGSGFLASQGTSTVTFNGVTAPDIVSWGNREIQVKVPAGITKGPVKVTTAAGTSNGIDFTPIPHIDSLSRDRAYPGYLVTIYGSGFGTSSSGGSVKFYNNKTVPPGDIVYWSVSELAVKVPAGAQSGNITITVGDYTSGGEYIIITLPPPSLNSLNQR